jgi:hypothetical protein
MKKLLSVLLVALFVTSTLATATPVAIKKVVKKHQRFDGTKVADDKGTKPVAPAKKKK